MDFISLELQKSKEQYKILHERYYNANMHSPDFNWQEYRNEGSKLGTIEKYKNVLESVCNDNSTSSTNRNKSCVNDSFPLIFNMLRYLENRLNSIELKGDKEKELQAESTEELKEDKDKDKEIDKIKSKLESKTKVIEDKDKEIEKIKMSDKSQLCELAKTVYESIKQIVVERRGYLTIDEEKFNSLNEYYKLYVLKKHISNGYINFKNEDFIYNTFKQHPNILIEILEYLLIINNFNLFTEIFTKHKRDIILKKDVYKKLLDISSRFIPSYSEDYSIKMSYDYIRLIMVHEVEDMLYNNDDII
jgi:hypothetical protein